MRDERSNIEVLISRHNAIRYLANELYKCGYSINEIAKALNISDKKAKNIIGRRVYRRFLNLLNFLDPITAFNISEEISLKLEVSPYKIKTIIAIELIKAGWGKQKIALALDISDRTVDRIKQRLKDGYYE